MRRLIVSALAALAAVSASGSAALAETSMFQTSEPPIVRVNLHNGDVTVRTWDRPQVQIDAGPGVNTERRTINFADREVPIFESAPITGKTGPIVLPAETFVVSTVPKGPREAVAVSGKGNVDMSIPANTPLLVVQVGQGHVSLDGMREGTFILRVRNGSAVVRDASNDGFVQVLRGAIVASDSTFNRLRVRSALSNVWFENCHAKQIEVTSVEGSVVFDNGSFEPGLARFESATGPVAIGVSGAATVDSHATDGQVFTLLDKHSSSDVKAGEGIVTIAGGGPIVTASSGSGDIFVYTGTLKDRRDIPPAWTPFLTRIKRTLPHPAGPRAGVGFRARTFASRQHRA